MFRASPFDSRHGDCKDDEAQPLELSDGGGDACGGGAMTVGSPGMTPAAILSGQRRRRTTASIHRAREGEEEGPDGPAAHPELDGGDGSAGEGPTASESSFGDDGCRRETDGDGERLGPCRVDSFDGAVEEIGAELEAASARPGAAWNDGT